MIVGVGIDIIEIQKIKDLLNRSKDIFLEKFFTEKEIKSAPDKKLEAEYFASRFAVKEAIFKAFGVGVFKYPGNEIEIKADGPPEASFYGDLADLSKSIGVENVSISISYDGGYAVGIAILES